MYNKRKTNCSYFYTIASTCFTFPFYITLLVQTFILQYDLYQRLRLQFIVLQMIGAMDARNM